MTTQHTPGPWVVDPDTATATVRSASGTSVARCYRGDEDARLIAAAPELLAALRAIQARIKGVWDDSDLVKFGELMVDSNEDILDIAEAAIAKATTNS